MKEWNSLGNKIWRALSLHNINVERAYCLLDLTEWLLKLDRNKPQINLHTGRQVFPSIIASTLSRRRDDQSSNISATLTEFRFDRFLECQLCHVPHSFIASLSFLFQSRLWFVCASPFSNDRKLFSCSAGGILLKLNSAGKVCWPWTLHSAMPTWLHQRGSSSTPKKESKPAWGY